MSASGEPPADEDPGVADPDNNDDNDVPDNNSDADTEPAMLEEEEMPTYMSLTSITSSSRLEESRAEVEIQQHPEKSEARDEKPRTGTAYADDDQAGDCVYVSSGDESERRPYDDEDGEDYDSDDMDLDEEDEEEEDEDDEDDSRPDFHGGEDSDAEIEQFERSSDDFGLRYDTGLEKPNKPRSRSLQDLTNSRSNRSRFVGKRRSIDIMDNYSTEYLSQNPETLRDPLADCKKSARSKRYAGVGSKVKLYIQQIKDQNRRSAERKNHESSNLAQNNFNEAEAAANVDVSCTRLNPASRLIKDYVQNVMKYMTVGIPEEAKDTIDREMRLEAEIIPELQLNIPNNLSKNLIPEKSNGLIDYSMQNHTETNAEPMETCTPNGQPQMSGILNLRTLSYEEYTNGDERPEKKIETEKNQIDPEKNGIAEYTEEQEEVIGITETETAGVPTSLKTETAKIEATVPEEAQGARESSDFPKSASHETQSSNRDGTDVPMLWAMLNQKTAQLNEKTAQYDGIRDAFQKTLTENISLKREMDELKKALAKYQKEPRETKVASVQTEKITETEEPPKVPNIETRPPMPKLMSTSVGSTLSSFEQWSDSNCSPAISINPPNIDNVLNSDDSFAGATPRKSARQLSQSFVTSSRILQTLSNITQGRTRAASYIAKNADSRVEQGQSKQDSNSPFVTGNEATPARSKKRKASDMTSPSEYEQSFKIPFTPGEPRRKINSDFKTDGETETPRVGETVAGASNDESSERLPDDFEDTGAIDVPNNVKCYVYQEETDSKERSFLIQAEDTPENSQIGDKAGTARECGPYLLGNVEIRMTQANGTINIWGKEVSQSTENLTADEEMDESELQEKPSTSRRQSTDCQRTPRYTFVNDSPFVCSTNKKSKDANSHFSRSGISKYFRPAFVNLARATGGIVDEGTPGHYRSSPILNNRTYSCEHCESHKKPQRFEWPNCDFGANCQRKQQHSCCVHGVEPNMRECDCARNYDLDDFDDDAVYETVSDVLTNRKQCDSSCHNLSTKHSCAEGTRRRQSFHNRQSPECEADCHHPKKRRSSCTGDIPACNQRLTPGNVSCRDNRNSHSRHQSCEDEEHPLISNRQTYETPETKRRRLSGKKVRGILTDLLRGCGGCRDPKNISYAGMETSSLPNLNPSVRVTPCTPPSHPSCSKGPTNHTHSKQPPRDLPTENGCSSCARRAAVTAEIESKLEILTFEMERLRSRSDTLRGMLDLVNSETD